jgi:hypothetical protein
MKKAIFFVVIFVFIFSSGCNSQIASIKKSAKSWIGDSIEVRKKLTFDPGSYASRIGWKEKTYQLDNENWVYVEPAGPDCFIHWEVNPPGIIVGYKLEGNRCW